MYPAEHMSNLLTMYGLIATHLSTHLNLFIYKMITTLYIRYYIACFTKINSENKIQLLMCHPRTKWKQFCKSGYLLLLIL